MQRRTCKTIKDDNKIKAKYMNAKKIVGQIDLTETDLENQKIEIMIMHANVAFRYLSKG